MVEQQRRLAEQLEQQNQKQAGGGLAQQMSYEVKLGPVKDERAKQDLLKQLHDLHQQGSISQSSYYDAVSYLYSLQFPAEPQPPPRRRQPTLAELLLCGENGGSIKPDPEPPTSWKIGTLEEATPYHVELLQKCQRALVKLTMENPDAELVNLVVELAGALAAEKARRE